MRRGWRGRIAGRIKRQRDLSQRAETALRWPSPSRLELHRSAAHRLPPPFRAPLLVPLQQRPPPPAPSAPRGTLLPVPTRGLPRGDCLQALLPVLKMPPPPAADSPAGCRAGRCSGMRCEALRPTSPTSSSPRCSRRCPPLREVPPRCPLPPEAPPCCPCPAASIASAAGWLMCTGQRVRWECLPRPGV